MQILFSKVEKINEIKFNRNNSEDEIPIMKTKFSKNSVMSIEELPMNETPNELIEPLQKLDLSPVEDQNETSKSTRYLPIPTPITQTPQTSFIQMESECLLIPNNNENAPMYNAFKSDLTLTQTPDTKYEAFRLSTLSPWSQPLSHQIPSTPTQATLNDPDQPPKRKEQTKNVTSRVYLHLNNQPQIKNKPAVKMNSNLKHLKNYNFKSDRF